MKPRKQRTYGARRPIQPAPVLTAVMVTTMLAAGCNRLADEAFCAGDEGLGCEFSAAEWKQVTSLANLGRAPNELDLSNRYVGFEPAIQLGWRLYYSTDFSGNAKWTDTLGRPTSSARAAKGTPMQISCASCHDPARAGSDFTSHPTHVSEGAGWDDVNAQQTLNVAHYKLLYWNGRSDSLWSQAAAVMESDVSMNGTRLATVWAVAEKFGADYEAVFPGTMPPLPGRAAQQALLDGATEFCKPGPAPGVCLPGCRLVVPTVAGVAGVCMPQFPLRGKPGASGCNPADPNEPFSDAFDCMDAADTVTVNRAYSNIVKAIGAYEWELASVNAPFDQFVNGDTSQLSPAGVRGLKLFVGRASCIDCHRTPLFSDGAFHNIGVPQRGESVPTAADCHGSKCNCPVEGAAVNPPGDTCLPWGFFAGLQKLRKGTLFRRDGAFSDNPAAGANYAAEYGLAADPASNVVVDAQLKGLWRTPSLRDVELTPPYMHDGLYRTLDDVIWHYDLGGTSEAVGSKAPELHPLRLSERDRSDLAEFLRSLTGQPLRAELHHAPPVAP